MRPKYLIGIFIGAFCIYLSIFGLSGFALPFQYQLTGDLMKADWNDMQGWYIGLGSGAAINPPGQLEIATSARVDIYKSGPTSFGDQFTCEAKVKIDNWGGATTTNIAFVHQTGSVIYNFAIYPDRIMLNHPQGTNVLSIQTDTNWHTWLWICDKIGGTQKVYRDGLLLVTWSNFYNLVSKVDTYILMASPSGSIVQAHVDYWYADTGAKTPGGTQPPSPDKAKITVRTAYWTGSAWQDVNVDVRVEKSGVYYGTWTTVNGYYGPQEVDPGTYTFSATYQTLSDSETITVVAGDSKTVGLGFGSTEPPPTPPPDIISWLTQLLANPTVKSLLLMIGIGMVGISGIMLVMPERKRFTPAPYPHYY